MASGSSGRPTPKKAKPIFIISAFIILIVINGGLAFVLYILLVGNSSDNRPPNFVDNNLIPRLNIYVNDAWRGVELYHRIRSQSDVSWCGNSSTSGEDELKKLNEEIKNAQELLNKTIDKIDGLEKEYKEYYKKAAAQIILGIDNYIKQNQKDKAKAQYKQLGRYAAFIAESDKLMKKVDELTEQLKEEKISFRKNSVEETDFLIKTKKYKDMFLDLINDFNSLIYFRPKFRAIKMAVEIYIQEFDVIYKKLTDPENANPKLTNEEYKNVKKIKKALEHAIEDLNISNEFKQKFPNTTCWFINEIDDFRQTTSKKLQEIRQFIDRYEIK